VAHWKGPVGSSRHIRVSCEAKAVLQVDYLEGARQIGFRVLGVVETEHSDQFRTVPAGERDDKTLTKSLLGAVRLGRRL